MNKKFLLTVGIIVVIVVVVGGVWRYSQKQNACVDVGCVSAGEEIPGAFSFSPDIKKCMATKCCKGLKNISYSKEYDTDCNPILLIGGPAGIYSNCGNEICEEWETKCNCPEDCE